MIESEEIKNHIATGVDAKIMQYEEHATNISDDKIDFPNLLGGTQTYMLLNMERNVERYKTSVEQLKKISIQNFQTADGGFSYWPGGSVSDEWGTNYAGHFLLEEKHEEAAKIIKTFLIKRSIK